MSVERFDADVHVRERDRLSFVVGGENRREELDRHLDLASNVHDELGLGRGIALGLLFDIVFARMASHPIICRAIDLDVALPGLDSSTTVVHVVSGPGHVTADMKQYVRLTSKTLAIDQEEHRFHRRRFGHLARH